MFRGDTSAKVSKAVPRRAKALKYPKGIYVIFNKKAYANRENLKHQAREEYKWHGAYSPLEREPRLLVLDAFLAHKKSADEVKAQDDFVAELKKINTTISMVPPGGTGYVQVYDGFANKKIKELISKREELYYDLNKAQQKAGKYSVSDRRVLLVQWTLEAYQELHKKYQPQIVKAFQQVRLSLNPDGSEDQKLKIRDLKGLLIP